MCKMMPLGNCNALPPGNRKRGAVISIEGLIGCGKSTLVTNLCIKRNYVPFFEPVETNPYLEDYYKDPKRFAFTMQVHLLWERYKMFQNAYYRSLQGEVCVLDRSPQGDYAFALVQDMDGYFTKNEFTTYQNMNKILHSQMASSDLMIWLDISPKEAVERIKKRSRECECSISLEYLEHLYKAYITVIGILKKRTNVVIVDARPDVDTVLANVEKVIDEELFDA